MECAQTLGDEIFLLAFHRLTHGALYIFSLVNPHQRCMYSDSPFVRIHYFYTAGSRTELEGVGAVATRKLYPRKKDFFLIQKYIEDAKQDEKHVPDLLESIMRHTDPVKEELVQKLFKVIQIRSKIPKIRVSTFWILEFRSFPAGGQRNLLAQ